MNSTKRRETWRDATRRYRTRLLERAKALFGNRCQKCGLFEAGDFEGFRLEFAHLARTEIRGRGRGSYQRLRDVLKHPESYALLCRPCHMNLDYAGRDPWQRRATS